MDWPGFLIDVKLVKRYKRFLADFEMADGTTVTGHCANTGSMVTCLAEAAPCWITHHDDPKRKLKYSWQAIQMADGWVGINTAIANKLVAEAIEAEVISELSGYAHMKAEVKYGTNSRIDLLLTDPNRADCYVEVKNVTLLEEEGIASFPDAVTARGKKHLEELVNIVKSGGRAVLCYCVQRESAQVVRPAEHRDPAYAATLREAVKQGLEVIAYKATFSKEAIFLKEALPVEIKENS